MKIKIIPEKCISCGLCHTYAPEIFDYQDNGVVRFYQSEYLIASLSPTKELLTAVKSCPTAALHVISEQNEH